MNTYTISTRPFRLEGGSFPILSAVKKKFQREVGMVLPVMGEFNQK